MINELWWLIMLILNFGLIMVAFRFWGKVGLFIWIPISVIIANIQVTKTVQLFTLEATLGNIVYATSFLATDILSECYTKKDARMAVTIGFFSMIVMTVMMNIALEFVPAESDFVHQSMKTIFAIMPRITIASLLAYAAAQFHDIYAYAKIKAHFPSTSYLWLRNNGSTLISQLIDSVIFTFVAFYNVYDITVLWQILLTTYVLKVVVAMADTPFIYLAKHWHTKKIVI
jgi:uncharacterized integral membrane protein (TIGR00697 family)